MSGFALALVANSGGRAYRRSSSCIDSMACVPDWIVIRSSYGLSLGRVQIGPLRWSHGSRTAQQHQGGEYTMKMPTVRQTILLVGTPQSSPWAVRAISAEPAETAGAAEPAAQAAGDAHRPGGR